MPERSGFTAALVALTIVATSCGTGANPVARESSAVLDSLPAVEELPAPLEADDVAPLSIDDSLLVEGDAPAPWDPMHRNLDTFAHDIGRNQTDCGPYWEYERLGRFQGGETMWWRDGGNLNHMVRREDSPGQAAALLEVFAALPQTCGVTSWSEGDSFTIEPLDLSATPGTDQVIALSIDHVRTDEVLWLAFAQRGDLISELRVTMWPEFESGRIPAFSPSDFGAVAATMVERLAAAGPERTTSPTTSSTVPGERPDDMQHPTLPSEPPDVEVPEIDPLPTITLPPVTSPATTFPPLDGLAAALLTSDELPTGWSAERPEEYIASDGDDDALADCPGSIAIVELDQHFEFSVDLVAEEHEDWGGFGMQFIGALPSDVDASALMRPFPELDCAGSDGGFEFAITGSTVEVPGADAAILVEVTQTGLVDPDDPAGEFHDNGPQTILLAVATIDSTLTAFTLAGTAPVLDFLQRAVDKVVAAD